jgi:hypothetical protein
MTSNELSEATHLLIRCRDSAGRMEMPLYEDIQNFLHRPETPKPTNPMPVIEVPINDITLNKELRRDIDAQIQRLKSATQSRERSIAITKLQEAVMWLGMDLKRINDAEPGASPNPYPNSKDPSNLKIEPTADGLKL